MPKLTREQIEAATPEQLRVWIAERLGWTEIKAKYAEDDLHGHPPGWRHGIEYPGPVLPNWPADIAAALELAESTGLSVTLFRNLWANGQWHWHCHIGGPINEAGEAWAEELTAPLAISRAWLLMKQEGKREELMNKHELLTCALTEVAIDAAAGKNIMARKPRLWVKEFLVPALKRHGIEVVLIAELEKAETEHDPSR